MGWSGRLFQFWRGHVVRAIPAGLGKSEPSHSRQQQQPAAVARPAPTVAVQKETPSFFFVGGLYLYTKVKNLCVSEYVDK